MNISFASKEIINIDHCRTLNNKSLFLFFLTTIGFGQLITFYSIIHQRDKLEGLNFQNVSKR